MWIVRLALRRPYTVAVMCLLVMLMGMLAMRRMAVDIFPSIDIPVVSVVWSYSGLAPEEMERRVVFLSERSLSNTVNGIQRIESQSIQGVGILRVYFHPGTDIGGAIAQITSVCASTLRQMPPGMTSPNIIQFNASNVPVVQLTARSKTLTEQQMVDHANNFIRLKLFTIPGLATPARRMCSPPSPTRTSSPPPGWPAWTPGNCRCSPTPPRPRWRRCAGCR